jgi:hypothetical protein
MDDQKESDYRELLKYYPNIRLEGPTNTTKGSKI